MHANLLIEKQRKYNSLNVLTERVWEPRTWAFEWRVCCGDFSFWSSACLVHWLGVYMLSLATLMAEGLRTTQLLDAASPFGTPSTPIWCGRSSLTWREPLFGVRPKVEFHSAPCSLCHCGDLIESLWTSLSLAVFIKYTIAVPLKTDNAKRQDCWASVVMHGEGPDTLKTSVRRNRSWWCTDELYLSWFQIL